jgi:hypothetical protein
MDRPRFFEIVRKLTFHTLLLTTVMPVLMVGCVSKESKANDPVLRVSWWNSEQERYAYVIRPAGNLWEVTVVTGGRTLEGPVLNTPLDELLSLAKTAQKQVATQPAPSPALPDETRRVVVSYGGAEGKKTFWIQGSVPELLKTIRGAPALERLLLLLSRDQPKDYRMLDEPRAGGPFGPGRP